MKIKREVDKILNIVEVLKEKLDSLQEKIDDRETKFDERSEKWQESEKGLEFSEETDRLTDLHLEIEGKIEDLVFNLDELLELAEQI